MNINQQRDSILKLSQSFETTQNVTALMIYQSALLVHNPENGGIIRALFQNLLQALPSTHFSSILGDLNQAFCLLMMEISDDQAKTKPEQSRAYKNVRTSLSALVTIYTSSSLACQLSGLDTDFIIALVEYYQMEIAFLSSKQNQNSIQNPEIHKVLQILSCLFLDGLLQQSHATSGAPSVKKQNRKSSPDIYHDDFNDIDDIDDDDDDDDDENQYDAFVSSIMETINLIQGYSDTCLGDLQQWQQQNQTTTILTQMQKILDDSDTRISYLFDMLRSSQTYQDYRLTQQTKAMNLSEKKNKNTTKKSTKSNKQSDPILPLIQQVQSVYPNLGQGYIEIALACYNFDPSLLISQLSNTSHGNTNSVLHPRLMGIDKKLPRQMQKSHTYSAGIDPTENEGIEARQFQKQFLANQMQQDEQNQYILSKFMEYTDDYDDQYDGVGNDGKVGASSTMDDTIWENGQQDYDSIKLYNEYVKQEETEDQYWKDMKNTNRSNKNIHRKSNKNENDDENEDDENEDSDVNSNANKKQWGPDKGKGGRAIGPDGKYLPFPKKGQRKKTHIPTNNSTEVQRKSNSDLSHKSNKGGSGNSNKNKKSSHTATSNNNGGGSFKGEKTEATSSSKDSSTAASELSKIQKRRKNDNKAKIANHNRKARATRKTGGM